MKNRLTTKLSRFDRAMPAVRFPAAWGIVGKAVMAAVLGSAILAYPIRGQSSDQVARASQAASTTLPDFMVVQQLPKTDGEATGQGPHEMEGTLTSNTPFRASGLYDTLSGALMLRLLKAESVDATVDAEVSVESGRVRLYLEALDGKQYRYVEASPGKPARLRGRLVYDMGRFGMVLESRAGQGSVVRYRVTRP